MADTKGALTEKVQDPQASAVAQALIDADKFHIWIMHGKVYASS
jgi:phosphoribosylformylglycinamidine (FGAM) synthase PurS component